MVWDLDADVVDLNVVLVDVFDQDAFEVDDVQVICDVVVVPLVWDDDVVDLDLMMLLS